MADSKVSALPAAVTLTGTELVPIVQAGNSVRSTVSSISGTATAVYTPPGTGAVPTTVAAKLAQFTSVTDYGAVGDGVTDDTAAFTAACTFLGALGGTVSFNKRHYIAGPLVIPQNVTLKGPFSLIGGPTAIIGVSYGTMAALILNTANPIRLSTGSVIDGALIVPQGMTFPQANSSAWVGTAVVIQGDNAAVQNSTILGFNQAIISGPICTFTGAINNGAAGAGTTLTASAVTGTILPGMVLYSNAIAPLGGTSIQSQITGPTGGAGTYNVSVSQNLASEALIGNIGTGPKIFNTRIDCINGVLINNPQDTGHCFNVECFPYATISVNPKGSTWADRSGTAFSVQTTFAGSGANCTFYDCFAFGYLNGFILTGTNDSILDGCWADGAGALANCFGFQIIGGFGGAENKLTACVATGQQVGFYINNNVGTETMLLHTTCTTNEVSAAAFGNKQIWINSGDAYLIGSTVRGTGSGGSGGKTDTAVYISGAASRVIIDGLRTQGLTGTQPPIYNFGQSPYIFLGNNDFRDFALGSSPIFQNTVQNVVSAGQVVTLPLSGDTFYVTGNIQIGGITGPYPGRRIRLIFNSACNVFHGQVAPNGILLAGGQTVTFPVNGVLDLVYVTSSATTYTGQWQQVSPMPLNSSGWGAATGGAVVSNFPGATATLLQTSTAVAQIINAMIKAGVAIGI